MAASSASLVQPVKVLVPVLSETVSPLPCVLSALESDELERTQVFESQSLTDAVNLCSLLLWRQHKSTVHVLTECEVLGMLNLNCTQVDQHSV